MDAILETAQVRAAELDEVLENKNTAYHRQYREQNSEKIRAGRVRRYHTNKEQDDQWRRNGIQRLRNQIFARYGEKCVMCGEENADTFVLAWIGTGVDPAKADSGGSTKRYRSIRQSEFPDGYETRCHNCNVLVRKNGRILAEEEKKAKEVERISEFSELFET